jgi:hypothetical protein
MQCFLRGIKAVRVCGDKTQLRNSASTVMGVFTAYPVPDLPFGRHPVEKDIRSSRQFYWEHALIDRDKLQRADCDLTFFASEFDISQGDTPVKIARGKNVKQIIRGKDLHAILVALALYA